MIQVYRGNSEVKNIKLHELEYHLNLGYVMDKPGTVEQAANENVAAYSEPESPKSEDETTDDDIRAAAKEAGISSYWNKSIEKLKAELKKLRE